MQSCEEGDLWVERSRAVSECTHLGATGGRGALKEKLRVEIRH